MINEIVTDYSVEMMSSEDKVIRIGQACGDWKTNLKSYEKVQGIVVDIKYLMKLSTRQNEEEIWVLADKIAQYVNERG